MTILTDSDRTSATWDRLKKHLTSELARLREANDHESADEKTSFTRGRIAQIKALLKLDEERQTRTGGGPHY